MEVSSSLLLMEALLPACRRQRGRLEELCRLTPPGSDDPRVRTGSRVAAAAAPLLLLLPMMLLVLLLSPKSLR